MSRSVGLIGLGIMGGAIARNLVASGWNVIGFDLSSERRAEASSSGVELADDVAALARRAPIIMTSLPSAAAVAETALALTNACVERRVVAELSTLSLDDKLEFASRLSSSGHVPLDCPLSGTGAQAKKRDLVVYASGENSSVSDLMPLFGDFAREAHNLGSFGNGTRMKLVANLLVAIHNVASAEAMALGTKAGLDPDQIVKLVGAGAGSSRIFELRAPLMASREYEPATMKIAVWQKDMDVIGRFASALGVSTPLFTKSKEVYDEALRQGLGPLDTAAVYQVIESRTRELLFAQPDLDHLKGAIDDPV